MVRPGSAVVTSTGRPSCSAMVTIRGTAAPAGPRSHPLSWASVAASRRTLRSAASVVGTLAT